MNIIEAAEAAKAGKRVAFKRNGEVVWTDGSLQWVHTSVPVSISEYTLSNDWRIIPETPKPYPFSVAFERMKQGHWMRPMGKDINGKYTVQGEDFVFNNGNSYITTLGFSMINCLWQEVTE